MKNMYITIDGKKYVLIRKTKSKTQAYKWKKSFEQWSKSKNRKHVYKIRFKDGMYHIYSY